ncbi:MAG: VENN motif pre-toxin domain-containing protein, partial [Rouxiella aceris]|uniref:VENN motif pre-toxin domain-containing protein n=1 Tax=Rouxiella aceris TaxID=2703884 RepID=UPI002851FCC2
KANISALSTLAAGLAGGVLNDSSMAGVQAAAAGKVAVENNFMVPPPAASVVVGGEAAAVASAVSLGVRQVSGKDDDEEMGGSCEGTREQCAVRDGTRGPGHTELPIADKDPTGGKLENPAPDQNKGTSLVTPDQSGGQGASNTGSSDGAPDIGGNTTTTPIPDGPNKDDLTYLALKGKELQEAAGKLGFDQKIPVPKVPFNSHGQPAFFDGKTYITPDVDSHNVTNGWKMFDRKGKRIGTYDGDLNRIKD